MTACAGCAVSVHARVRCAHWVLAVNYFVLVINIHTSDRITKAIFEISPSLQPSYVSFVYTKNIISRLLWYVLQEKLFFNQLDRPYLTKKYSLDPIWREKERVNSENVSSWLFCCCIYLPRCDISTPPCKEFFSAPEPMLPLSPPFLKMNSNYISVKFPNWFYTITAAIILLQRGYASVNQLFNWTC